LSEAGTSFNRIVDELRQELAEKYLMETSLSITEIAFAVGYTNVSAFDTAFKRWTGQTPYRYRAHAA
jgi:AraC-like DNA-binding protein